MVGRTRRAPSEGSGFLPWARAMEQALYGPNGFYRSGGGPAAHFRTSVHASPLFATAVVRLLREVDEVLGRPDPVTLVDVGAGRGELLEAVGALLGDSAVPDDTLPRRLRLVAVEIAPRPDHLTSGIEWRRELPDEVTGLLIANEWLDNVPCDIAEATADGWRIVDVAPDGVERLAAVPDPDQRAWLSTWWPVPGSPDEPATGGRSDDDENENENAHATPFRAEVGLTRDAAWRHAVETLARGVAAAVDYAHHRALRPPFGTLSGYAHGRQVAPIPDGTCDITAHVALDACAAAAGRADWTVLTTQRTVFHSLGITGGRPDLALASTDPRGYLRALSQASAAAELTDPDGLGGFGWLAQGVGVPVLPSLARLRPPSP